MGRTPIPKRPIKPPPTRESFHLGRAREAYYAGTITQDKFERCVEIVVAGGHLPQDLQRVN